MISWHSVVSLQRVPTRESRPRPAVVANREIHWIASIESNWYLNSTQFLNPELGKSRHISSRTASCAQSASVTALHGGVRARSVTRANAYSSRGRRGAKLMLIDVVSGRLVPQDMVGK